MLELKAWHENGMIRTSNKMYGLSQEITRELAALIVAVITRLTPAAGSTHADLIREVAESAIRGMAEKIEPEKSTHYNIEMPPDNQIKKCTSCGADIFFIKTPLGKYMPCDKMPVFYKAVSGGKERVVLRSGEVVACEYLEKPDGDTTGIGFKPHWQTCPHADKHRRATP